MNRKLAIYILFCICIFHDFNTFAQSFNLIHDFTFGGTDGERDSKVVSIDSFNIIVIGSSNSNIGGNKTDPLCIDSSTGIPREDMWLLKLDSAFNIIFDKSIGGFNDELSPSIMLDATMGMVVSGTSKSGISCEKSDANFSPSGVSDDFWVFRSDANGNINWDKTYGGTGMDHSPKIIQINSNNFIVCGGSSSTPSGNKTSPHYGMTDYWILMIDTLGFIQWDKTIGGANAETIVPGSGGFSILCIDTVSFILVGGTNSSVSGTITTSPIGSFDVLLNKIDINGSIIWEKRLGGLNSDRGTHIINTIDDGFILLGLTNSPQGGDITDVSLGGNDSWIVKLDSSGNKMWDKRYGGTEDEYGIQIARAPGSGYYVLNSCESDSGFDVSENAYGQSDYWFFEIDSVGNKLWDKRFGGPGQNIPTGFTVLADSSILLFGYADSGTSAVKTDPGKGGLDYWLVHFKYDNTTAIQEYENSEWITLSPNPSGGLLQVPPKLAGYDLTVYDISGRTAFQQNKLEVGSIRLDYLSPACYLLHFTNAGKIFRAKWMKL